MSPRERHRKRGYRRFFRKPAKGAKPYNKKHATKQQSNICNLQPHDDDFCSPMQTLPNSSELRARDSVAEVLLPTESLSSEVRQFEAKDPIIRLTDCIEHPISVPQVRAKRAIRVLSLFDGIATGLHVLDKLGLEVEVYFSAETDPNAIGVQLRQHPGRMSRLGCVTTLTSERLKALGRVDLLLGGSPCNDLSTANAHPRGLHGEGSSGRLFFEYVRVRDHLQRFAEEAGRPFKWFFENTFSMEKKSKKEISRALGCQPTMRCASKFVPMVRRRLFWGNLPAMHEPFVSRVEVPTLNDLLRPNRQANVLRCPTITTKKHSQKSGPNKSWPIIEDGVPTPLQITELEALFGFPEGYTDGPNPSYSARAVLLGKAWCVPVIMSFFRPLRAFFLVKCTGCTCCTKCRSVI